MYSKLVLVAFRLLSVARYRRCILFLRLLSTECSAQKNINLYNDLAQSGHCRPQHQPPPSFFPLFLFTTSISHICAPLCSSVSALFAVEHWKSCPTIECKNSMLRRGLSLSSLSFSFSSLMLLLSVPLKARIAYVILAQSTSETFESTRKDSILIRLDAMKLGFKLFCIVFHIPVLKKSWHDAFLLPTTVDANTNDVISVSIPLSSTSFIT